MGRTVRRRALGAVLAAAAVLAAGSVLHVQPASAHGPLKTNCVSENEPKAGQYGTWLQIPVRSFPAGPQRITAHAVDPSEPRRWWITNGKSVMRSQDSGCSFSPVFTLPTAPTGDLRVTGDDRITGIAVAPRAPDAHRVYLTVASLDDLPARLPKLPGEVPVPAGTVTVTQVVRSDNAGAASSWVSTAPLAAPAGGPGPIRTSLTDPLTVYAVAGGVLNASTDGGATWRAASIPATAAGGDPRIKDFTVDSVDPAEVWAVTGGRIVNSVDRGVTWKASTVPATGARGPAVSVGGVSPTVVTVPVSSSGDGRVTSLYMATEKSRRFAQVPASNVAGPAQSIAGGRGFDLVLASSDAARTPSRSGVYRYNRDGGLVDIDEFRLARQSPLLDVIADRDPSTRYYFHTDNSVVIFADRTDPAMPRGGGTTDAFGFFTPPAPPQAAPATLSPATARVPVQPGGSADTPYSLNLPRQPVRLDAFFLLDTSESTEPYINGLRNGLADLSRRLVREGIDAQFGLGEYQDWQGAHNVRYRLRDQIGPPDRAYQKSLREITVAGGEEPGYMALHQMATGVGIDTPRKGPRVDPGQQARWRPGAYRLAVVVADESYVTDPDSVTPAQAVAALVERKIHTVGIHVGTTLPDVTEGPTGQCRPVTPPIGLNDELRKAADRSKLRCQMYDVARATDALAPAGGVDCDGDGRMDVLGGRPLVCGLTIDEGRNVVAMTGPLTRILTALTTPTAVDLVGRSPSGATVAVRPAADFSATDVRRDARLGFTVTTGCSAEQAGTVLPVTLTARVATLPVATANLDVVCGDPPVAPARPAPAAVAPAQPAPAPAAVPVIGPQPALAVSNPPPPPIVPVHAPAPAAQPGAAPAAQSVPMGQVVQAPGAAAAQRRAEAVALARIDAPKPQTSTELAFSAYTPSAPDRTPLVPLVGGLLATAAATVHSLRRKPPSVARARWR